MAGERGRQLVAAVPEGEPAAADVPVIGTGADELGEGELLEAAGVQVCGRLRVGDRLGYRLGQHQPAQPQSRRQGLARGAHVDDMLGRQRLERAGGWRSYRNSPS